MNRITQKIKRSVDTLIFDLDDTLYPRACGLMPKIGEQIRLYTMQRFNMPADEADAMRRGYKDTYGSTLVGYVHVNKVDPAEFEDFVYDIDYSQYIPRDEAMIKLFTEAPYRKIIYTNGARRHALSVIRELGIPAESINQIVALEDTAYYAKPMHESYRKMISLTGIIPGASVFFDDQERNLIAAQPFNIATVLVGGKKSDQADFCMDSVSELVF